MKFVPRAPIDNRRGEQYTRSKTQNAPPAARRALIKGGIRHDPKTVRFAAALRGTGPLPAGWLRRREKELDEYERLLFGEDDAATVEDIAEPAEAAEEAPAEDKAE